MSELSRRILQRRLELGLSQEELAQRMGYRSKSSITKLEKGINDLPRATLEELAAALEVSLQTIGALENGRYIPSILLAFKIARYFGLTIEEIFIYELGGTGYDVKNLVL